MSFYTEITNLILSKQIQSKEELHKTKLQLCKKYQLDTVPPDSEILARLPDDCSEEDLERATAVLRKKPMRTISGVAVIAVMTSPEACPHGKCTPCPGGPDYQTPQSYTGFEPAAMRATLNDFDPYLQTKRRLEQLRAIGHPTDKIDFIVMGGTFTARPWWYQEWFVKRCFDALNGTETASLATVHASNENASARCIGLTVETRPDWFRLHHADHALMLGATRVELGVQTLDDTILYQIKRGHTVGDTIAATRIAKDSGFKCCYHLMPGLPGSDEHSDIAMMQQVFEDDNFKPDMLKIYPTLTIKGTPLYDDWKKGNYEPLTTRKAAQRIAMMKAWVPEWVRIQRIQRDVPVQHIDAGVDKSNLRQLVEKELITQGKQCRCIRCREIGHKSLKEPINIDDDAISLECTFYKASQGEEVFLSLVDKQHDALVGYLRLRDVGLPHRHELQKHPCMIIRELKVLGRELSIGTRSKTGWQHKGYGKELLDEAARLCREEFEKKYLFVLSGIGVKAYYRKLGFKDTGVYLSKKMV